MRFPVFLMVVEVTCRQGDRLQTTRRDARTSDGGRTEVVDILKANERLSGTKGDRAGRTMAMTNEWIVGARRSFAPVV